MAFELEDIFHPNADNPAGTKLVFFYAMEDEFTTISKPVAEGSAADLGDLSTIADDHVFSIGNCFKKMEIETNKNDVLSELQGAVSAGADKFTMNFFQTNISPKQSDAFRLMRRKKMIVLVPLPDGQVLQLGQENNGAMLKSGMQTGTQEGGERGNPGTIEAYHYAQFYTGTISFTPAAE